MKKLTTALLLLVVSCVSVATEVYVSTTPTAWRLQNYVPGNVVLWFAGTSCASGQATLPASATTEDRNRLYATVLSAKMSAKPVFIYYDNAAAGCPITSFGAPN